MSKGEPSMHAKSKIYLFDFIRYLHPFTIQSSMGHSQHMQFQFQFAWKEEESSADDEFELRWEKR